MLTRRRLLLLTVFLASFMSAFMGSSLNVALPSMSLEFGMNAVMTGWIASSFLLATAVSVLPSGRLSDLKGRRRVFVLGIVINMTASAATVFSQAQWMLIVCRVLQGTGAAMMFATSNPIVITAYPPHQRGRVLGFVVGAVYAGLSAGPFLGGILTHNAGWRSIFLFNAAVLFITLVLALRYMEKDHPESHGEPFDYTGSVLNALFLSTLIFAMARVPTVSAWILFALSAVFGALFIRQQKRSPHPVLRLSLLRGNSVFLKSNLAAMINYSATFAVAFLLSLYLQYVRGFTPQDAGLILLCQPVMQAVLSPVMGKLSDTVEPWILSSAGMALIAAVLALFIFLGGATPVALISAALVFLGIGFALFSSPNTNAVMGSVGKKDLGMASALLSTMRVFGQILSMGIAMLVFSLVIGRVRIDQASAGTFLCAMRVCFVVFSILCAAGIYFSMSRGVLHKRKESLPVIPPSD